MIISLNYYYKESYFIILFIAEFCSEWLKISLDQNTYRYQAREATTLYMYIVHDEISPLEPMSWGEMCVASFWFPLSTSRSCCFPFGLIFVRKMFPLCSSSVYPFFSGAFPFLSWSGVLSVRDSRRRICADWRWLDLFVFDFSLRLPIPRCYAFPGVVLFCLSASRSDTVVTGKVPFFKKSVFFFCIEILWFCSNF